MPTPNVSPFHYQRGRIFDVAKARLRHQRALKRHGALALQFPQATASTFFIDTPLGCGDQGNCGSCYLCSAAKVASNAMIRAGVLPNDPAKGMLSWQYGLDCQSFGGCNGGDEGEVIQFLHDKGFPTTDAYGSYSAGEGRCKGGSPVLYKLKDFGYCDPTVGPNGVAATQLIKNALVQYGNPISVAGAAGGDWDGLGSDGIISGNSRDVNHAISLVGWDDSKGAWAMENQWGTGWGYAINGKPGRAWIKYGADSIGTEAIWVDGGQPLPPPPPPWTFATELNTRPQIIVEADVVHVHLGGCGCKGK